MYHIVIFILHLHAQIYTQCHDSHPQVPSDRADHRLAAAVESARCVLSGYVVSPAWVVEELVACLDSPALALLQWQAELHVARGRLPGGLVSALEGAVAAHAEEVAAVEAAAAAMEAAAGGEGAEGGAGAMAAGLLHCGDFPAGAVVELMEAALQVGGVWRGCLCVLGQGGLM